MIKKKLTLLSAALVALSAQNVVADENWQSHGHKSYKRYYEVSITNITKGQTFTPQLVATHARGVSMYELGEPASDELATLAESGNTGPLTTVLQNYGNRVADVQTIDGLLGPGETTSVYLEARPRTSFLSLSAMLIPTNDTFVGGDGLRLPRHGSRTYFVQAIDAGTEYNDQKCISIPGPRCGGEGDSEPSASDEGFVYISNGFHDLGSADEGGNEILSPFTYDWRNPVAKVVVKRVY